MVSFNTSESSIIQRQINRIEEKERRINEARDEFIKLGKDYTEGFLRGRKGRIISNLFSLEYRGARMAIDKMTGGSYSENEILKSGRYFQG